MLIVGPSLLGHHAVVQDQQILLCLEQCSRLIVLIIDSNQIKQSSILSLANRNQKTTVHVYKHIQRSQNPITADKVLSQLLMTGTSKSFSTFHTVSHAGQLSHAFLLLRFVYRSLHSFLLSACITPSSASFQVEKKPAEEDQVSFLV